MSGAKRVVPLLFAVVLAAAAQSCTRSLRPAMDEPASLTDAQGVDGERGSEGSLDGAVDAEEGAEGSVDPVESELISIDSPAPGARVTSPVLIGGTVDLESGRLPAAQVLSLAAEGGLTRRGNGPIPVDDDGRFEALIEYYIEAGSAGVVEVVIIDPATGAVTERERVVVELEAAP